MRERRVGVLDTKTYIHSFGNIVARVGIGINKDAEQPRRRSTKRTIELLKVIE